MTRASDITPALLAELKAECKQSLVFTKDSALMLAILDLAECAIWRPIETAPKDGTVIDMWTHDRVRVANIRWVIEPREGVAHQDCIMDGWKYPGYDPWGCMVPEQFTHWMPPPEPPPPEPAPLPPIGFGAARYRRALPQH